MNKKNKGTYISSQGVTFVEKPDIGIKIGKVKDFTIHNWNIVSEPDLRERTFSTLHLWFKLLFIPFIKFKIVRWLYKTNFDAQLKQKGLRCGLKIVKQ